MHNIYFFAKYAKWLGLIGIVGGFFSHQPILQFFKLFWLLIIVEILLNFSVYKCSFFQIIGILKVNNQFKDNAPSVDNYQCEGDYNLPFNGKWIAINGCFRKEYSHSWDIPTQRYAYDFIILDKDGKSYSGEFNRCESYYCYNMEILAPADGEIVEVVNNAKDSLIFNKGRFYSTAPHIAGNYIVIKHTENEYSTLAHLKKDSIVVSVGDTVSRGQIVAKCGNTGNSTEPHLHFQLQRGQSFYNSVGLPIHFTNIKLSEVDNYAKYDLRPHMALELIPKGFMTRGFISENL